jgi:hypothetical protein
MIEAMLRLSAIVVALWFVLLGTGAIECLHNLEHAREDAALVADQGQTDLPVGHHDDTNCSFHLQLHIPVLPIAWIPLLICLGLFVAFPSEFSVRLAPQRAVVRIDCRGPPVL